MKTFKLCIEYVYDEKDPLARMPICVDDLDEIEPQTLNCILEDFVFQALNTNKDVMGSSVDNLSHYVRFNFDCYDDRTKKYEPYVFKKGPETNGNVWFYVFKATREYSVFCDDIPDGLH